MVNFVTNIASYARAHSPLGQDFGVIVQNAEDLAANHPDYVRTVTGIGREEVYVQATNKPTSNLERSTAQHYLDLFHQKSRGKLVLTIDYANNPDQIRGAYEGARGYVPYAAPVDLDRLQVNAGYLPVCDEIS